VALGYGHGRQWLIASACRARRSGVQPFAITRLQNFALLDLISGCRESLWGILRGVVTARNRLGTEIRVRWVPWSSARAVQCPIGFE